MPSDAQAHAASRAAALLDAAPGLYSLRKRTRSQQQQPPKNAQFASSRPPQTVMSSSDTSMSVEVAPLALGPMSAESAAGGEDGGKTGAAVSPDGCPASGSLIEVKQPQGQAVSPVIPKEDAKPRPGSKPEDDDDSSLTSLSDIEERLVLVTPQPARAQQQESTSSRKRAPPRKRQSTASTATSRASLSSAGNSEYRPGPRVASGLVASPDSSDSEASDDDEYRPATCGGRGRGGAVLRKRTTRSQGPGSATKSRSSATTPARTRKQAEEQAAQSPAPSISTTKRTKTDSEAPRTVTSPASTLNAAAPVPAPPPVSPPVMTCIPVPQLRSNFRPGAMPTLASLYEHRHRILREARLEATRDPTLQHRSEEQIESALAHLDEREQQLGLCTTMNRYSAFCALDAVDLPPFPITAKKVALFLGRSPATPESALLRSAFPQPREWALPVASVIDPNLMPEEGTRVSRELVRFWVEALSYAQRATHEIWDSILGQSGAPDGFGHADSQDGPGSSQSQMLVCALEDDAAVREIILAVETSEAILKAEEQAQQAVRDAQASAQLSGARNSIHETATKVKGKTKWTKGGKSVAPPVSSVSTAASSDHQPETRPSAPNSNGSGLQDVPSHADPFRPVLTKSQTAPVLPIASAPMVLPPPAPLLVPSQQAQPLDVRRQSLSTTSSLSCLPGWTPRPDVPGFSSRPERPGPLPTPLSIEDANFVEAPGLRHDFSPWAQQFLQVPSPTHFAAFPSPVEANQHVRDGADWHAPGPLDGIGSSFVGSATEGLPDSNAHGALTSANSLIIQTSPDVPGWPYASVQPAIAPQQEHAVSRPARTSSFDLLAAVASDLLPVPGFHASSSAGHHLVPTTSFEQSMGPTSPTWTGHLQGNAPNGHVPIAHFGRNLPLDGRAQTPFVSDSLPYSAIGADHHESHAQPFEVPAKGPHLSELVHSRSQSHPASFTPSTSQWGRFADSALAGLPGPAHLAPVLERTISSPYTHPPAYPTPESPVTGAGSGYQLSDAVHGPTSFVQQSPVSLPFALPGISGDAYADHHGGYPVPSQGPHGLGISYL